MRLYLVRHGQSTGNLGDALVGQSDHPLSELGHAQAEAVARALAPHGPMDVYTSDLPRAVATAERILAAWSLRDTPGGLLDAAVGRRPRLVPDPRLREINLGEYEGRPWREFAGDEGLAAALAADPLGTVVPGGESLAQLQERVLAALADVLAAGGEHLPGLPQRPLAAASAEASGMRSRAPRRAACVVTHDGPLRAIVNHLLAVPAGHWWTVTTSHAGISVVDVADGVASIRALNCTAHLEGVA